MGGIENVKRISDQLLKFSSSLSAFEQHFEQNSSKFTLRILLSADRCLKTLTEVIIPALGRASSSDIGLSLTANQSAAQSLLLQVSESVDLLNMNSLNS